MDKFLEKGSLIPEIAGLLAVSSFVQFLKIFPMLKQINPKDWDYFVTIAGIQMGLTSVEVLNITEKEKEPIRISIVNSAIDKYSDAGQANEDCWLFIKRASEGKILDNNLLAACLGTWVVRNLFGKAPVSVETMKLAQILGEIIVDEFKSYWR